MRVSKKNAQRPDERLEELRAYLETIGDFFPWDVHPNKVKASNLLYLKTLRKIKLIIDSEEYQRYL